MDRSDVSFTFLDRIREIEENIEDGRFQSALALAVTLPDICGGIAFPELVKRGRDGRTCGTDPGTQPGHRAAVFPSGWIHTGPRSLKKDPADRSAVYLRGAAVAAEMRVPAPEQGFDNDTPDTEVRFHLGLNCGSSICNLDTEDGSDIRLDIEELCRRICLAARSFYEETGRTWILPFIIRRSLIQPGGRRRRFRPGSAGHRHRGQDLRKRA